MPTPSLPAEIHELIIDWIGDGFRESLQACALVCKHWHIYTLPYIFGSIDLSMSSTTKQLECLKQLLQVLDSNPLIRSRAQSLVLSVNDHLPEFDDALGKLASRIQLVTELTITFSFPISSDLPPFFDNNSPSFPHLQHLNFIRCREFRTSSLAVFSNLKSLTFEDVRRAIADHGEDFYPRASLQKLVLTRSEDIMQEMQENARLRDAFGNIQNLEITFLNSFAFVVQPQWEGTFNWENLRSLSVSSWLHCKSYLNTGSSSS